MNKKKKEYLSLYLLQHAKIKRLNEMIKLNPEEKPHYLTEIKEATLLREEIERKIQAVGDGTLSELLYLKYVCGKSLLQISYILNYSTRHTERLHIKALEKFNL